MKYASENPSPKLRFKGFEKSWRIVKGGELFGNRREKGKEDLPIYSVSIDQGLIPRSSIEKHMKDDADAEKNCAVKPGDISYNTMRMWQGAMGVSDLECMVSPAYIVLTPHKNTLSGFYFYLFKSNKYLHALKSYSYGLTSDRLRLYYKDFAAIPFPTCAISEQQKVVDFLTAVDKRIGLIKEKYALLQQYKKGVMQQLFSNQIRFKDDNGNDFPDWREIRLEEALGHRSEKAREEIRELLSVTMHEGVKRKFETGGVDNSSQDKSNYKRVRVGDIAYNSMRMWQGAFGLSNYDGIVSPAYTVIYAKKDMCPEYFSYFFKYEPIINLFRRNSQGLTKDTWNLKYPQFSAIKVKVPSGAEQKKIAEFITMINKKIDLVAKQTELTKTFKKGLMQQMFV